MPSEYKFIVDTMLGDLARWLRILGYDTVYSRIYSDREVLELAFLGGRVLITRDGGLHRKAVKMGVKSVLVESTIIEERLAEASVKLGIDLIVNPEKSRCPECNGVLERVEDKSLVKDRVPPNALNSYDVFYLCVKCGKAYWEGSHWRNIRKVIDEARRLAEEYRKAYRPRKIKSKKGFGGGAFKDKNAPSNVGADTEAGKQA
ncbi:MAG: Mut7-C RNAse domain-containing protein [Thermoprotei archaeon]|nr:Mut7-C RNAse domain-containing protein [Thermoprotei archaeon]